DPLDGPDPGCSALPTGDACEPALHDEQRWPGRDRDPDQAPRSPATRRDVPDVRFHRSVPLYVSTARRAQPTSHFHWEGHSGDRDLPRRRHGTALRTRGGRYPRSSRPDAITRLLGKGRGDGDRVAASSTDPP